MIMIIKKKLVNYNSFAILKLQLSDFLSLLRAFFPWHCRYFDTGTGFGSKESRFEGYINSRCFFKLSEITFKLVICFVESCARRY